ncbi:MAG: sugar phosphate nucleotidyltransferase [Candidatus Saccharibacteria bacterium]|nr:sugar phosphate nucleotidyltransferase [Candidatus Saccharibacteria bacterium]
MSLSHSMIDTAVVMCGGMGTRDLPHTLVRPNTLGEIGRRNTFDIITEQLANVGVQNLVVVIPNIKTENVNLSEILIGSWFRGNPKLRDELRAKGKPNEQIVAADNHSHGIDNLYFAYQDQAKYGTAASVAAAINTLVGEIETERFLVVNGDGFMHRTDGGSDIQDLIAETSREGAAHGLLTTTIEKIHEGKYPYGIIERDEAGNFVRINEGPQADQVTTEHPEGNLGIYLFSASIFPLLNEFVSAPLPADRKEYWITDVIETAAQKESVIALPTIGEFVDCATPELREQARALLTTSY